MMNQLDWDAIQALRRSLDPSHQNDVDNSTEKAKRTNNEWDDSCEYSRPTAEPQSSKGENVALRGVPPSHNFCSNGSEVKDPDGQPLEKDKEDPELARKRKELQEIEERILFKKAAIALKSVEPDFSCNLQSATCKGVTLKERVNVILQQRLPVGFLSKVQSPRERRNSYSLSKDGVLQDNHPLKLRVRVLMKHRSSGSDHLVSPASREVPDVTPPPPSWSATSPAKEENGVDKGFQCFLSLLNKGVDMDFLSRIVNDDNVDLPLREELLDIQPPAPENNSNTPIRRESERSNSGASLPGCSRTTSRERNTDPPSQETSLHERLSLPDDDEKKKDRGDRRFGSGSRSKSPVAVKKKKKKEEEKPKVDEQREQLQNILKTLGLSLEVEEMSKLADRTQERLYGKKHEDRTADSRGEQESQQRDSQRHCSDSSSSSSSSSSSRSASKSCSPSPSRHRRSRSRDSRQRSECRRLRDRSKDRLTHQDNDYNTEAKRYSDKDEEHPKETSDYQHPYPQNQLYPHTTPDSFSALPDYSLPQVSDYSAYHSDNYSSSYWTHTQGGYPPSLYHSGFPYPQNTYHHFPVPEVAPNLVYPHHSSADMNSFVNPDLYERKGQRISVPDARCLQVVKGRKLKNRGRTKKLRYRAYLQKKAMEMAMKNAMKRKKNADKQMVSESPHVKEDDSKAEEPGEKKHPRTEEEVKTNLKKMLDAYNQKVKQNVTQPANPLTSLTG